MWNWCYGIGNGGFFGWGGGFLTMLWPILLIVVVFYLFQNKKEVKDDHSAIRILKEEYAKGKITKEEFLDKKKDIL